MANSILESVKVNESDSNEYQGLEFVVKPVQLPEEKPVPEYVEWTFKEYTGANCPYNSHTESSIKDDIDTGFAINDSLSLKPCTELPLSQPLYKENYLSEFLTEEEKRMARHNLGLFDTQDVVGMSLLTAGEQVTDFDTISKLNILVLEKGTKPVAVLTVDKAVYVKQDNRYTTLDTILNQQSISLDKTNSRIDALLQRSYEGSKIKTLGDLEYFLDGFLNNVHLTLILESYLQFESKGELQLIEWKI